MREGWAHSVILSLIMEKLYLTLRRGTRRVAFRVVALFTGEPDAELPPATRSVRGTAPEAPMRCVGLRHASSGAS